MARRTLLISALLMALAGGCASWRKTPALPVRNSIVLDQLVIYSDFPLPQHHRLLQELTTQRSALVTKLGLPTSDEPIHVYLFGTPEQFRKFMGAHYPELPERRAFFVESDTRLMVYAYWGDRVAEDLRHEVAHGYLHSVINRLPLWLDEGLAEYFEVSRGQRGLNKPHVHELAAAQKKGWKPDLERLEQLRSPGDMTQNDYAESWAWVHFMLEGSPENQALLRSHLQAIRKGERTEPLSSRLGRLHADYERALLTHVAGLEESLR